MNQLEQVLRQENHPTNDLPSLRVVPGTPEPTATQLGMCRRFRFALYDLGLIDILGGDWIRPEGDGFVFDPRLLSIRMADQLLRRLDTLVAQAESKGHRNRFGSSNFIADDPALRPDASGTGTGCVQFEFFPAEQHGAPE